MSVALGDKSSLFGGLVKQNTIVSRNYSHQIYIR